MLTSYLIPGQLQFSVFQKFSQQPGATHMTSLCFFGKGKPTTGSNSWINSPEIAAHADLMKLVVTMDQATNAVRANQRKGGAPDI